MLGYLPILKKYGKGTKYSDRSFWWALNFHKKTATLATLAIIKKHWVKNNKLWLWKSVNPEAKFVKANKEIRNHFFLMPSTKPCVMNLHNGYDRTNAESFFPKLLCNRKISCNKWLGTCKLCARSSWNGTDQTELRFWDMAIPSGITSESWTLIFKLSTNVDFSLITNMAI